MTLDGAWIVELSTGLDRAAAMLGRPGAGRRASPSNRGRAIRPAPWLALRGDVRPRAADGGRPVTLDLYLRGVAVGFAIAFVLGPIGLLVIRRTVDRGWSYGLLSGVGVATADALYGAIAAFGLTAVSNVLVGVDRPLGIVGGAVLVVCSPSGPCGSPSPPPAMPRPSRTGRLGSPLAAWASMVALTATNPATILSFAALFASIGAGTGGASGAVAVVAGVFLGVGGVVGAAHRGSRRGRAAHAAGRAGPEHRVRRGDRRVRGRRRSLGAQAEVGSVHVRPDARSMPTRSSAAAVFDWDGTLVDTMALI